LAGVAAAAGECCAVIDCDLQHPPEKLPEMYSLWQQGFEIINGEKRSRGKESALHRTAAGLFNLIMNKALKTDMTRSSDFKLIDRRVARALLEMPERRVFFRALSAWVGYRATSVEFDVVERKNGSSNWSALGLAKYALANVTSFSSAPMQIVTVLGLVTLVFSLVIGIQTLVKWFGGSAVPGFTTVIILLLFIGSVLMISLGIIGYYIAQIYAQIKGRPRYIVARRCGGGEFDE
jgi:dolichol-phosphate mannosyltransferase